jgi:hypothetical protein
MEIEASAPITLKGRMDEARGDLLDAVVTIDRLIASLTATRAELVDGVRGWIETSESVGRRPGRHGWNDSTVARRVLVSELAAALRISEREAGRLASESETLVTELPSTLDALREGRITYRHASVLVDQVWSLPSEARESFASGLLPHAEALGAGPFARLARQQREAQHPESAEVRRRSAFERRSVGVDPARDGMAWLSAYLPAEQAIAIDDRLDRIAAALRSPDEQRHLAQLRTDAFADILLACEAAGGAGVGSRGRLGRGIQAQVLVTVPVLTLMGAGDEPARLEGYGPIDAETARRLAGGSTGFTRILTHPETGVVLSVGRDRYTVPVELRRALRFRDGTCRMVGCERRTASCDVDHTTDWQYGGPTAVDNLAHLCRRHHQLKHHTDWKMTQLAAGDIQWTSPTGRLHTTRPVTALPGVAPPGVLRHDSIIMRT